MLFHAHAPLNLWFDAFATATYIINRLPSSVLQHKSPFEVLFGCPPYYPTFKPFGCRVFPYLRDYSPHKLAPRSAPCIFLGYSSFHKGFRCFDPVNSRVYITRNAQFDENYFPFSSSGSAAACDKLEFTSFYENSSASPSSSSPPMHSSSSCPPCSSDLDPATSILPMAVQPSQPPPSPLPDNPPPSPPPSPAMNSPPPPPMACVPTHSMVTRSKAGIFKPKYPINLAPTPLLSTLTASTAAT